MKYLVSSFVISSLLFLTGISVAQEDFSPKSIACTTYASQILKKNVGYCIDRSRPDLSSVKGEPVVYFMHGTHGGAKTWIRNKYFKSLNQLRDQSKLAAVTFVSFDTSAYSFFTDQPASKDTSKAYETWFVSEFLPFIERTYSLCNERKCRGLMGESMGGFGAIKTGLRHPDLFSVISVNDPALSPFETNQPMKVWVDYLRKKPIGYLRGKMLAKIFLGIFPDEDSFEANDPTHLVKSYSSIYPFPALYFDMGGKDDYGFYDGYTLFKAALDQRGFSYSTYFDPESAHDMWTKHSIDALAFIMANLNH